MSIDRSRYYFLTLKTIANTATNIECPHCWPPHTRSPPPRLLLALSTHRLRRSSQHPPTSQLSLQRARGAQTGHRRHQILGVVTESSEPQSGRLLDDDGQLIRDCRTRIPSSGKARHHVVTGPRPRGQSSTTERDKANRGQLCKPIESTLTVPMTREAIPVQRTNLPAARSGV